MHGLSEAKRLSLACCALALSLVCMAACGSTSNNTKTSNTGMAQNAAAAGASASPMADGMQSADPGMGGAGMDCTKATKVTIVEKASMGMGDTYAFSPKAVTLMRGGFLAITNKSDEVHALVSVPDSGIVTTAIDKKERQVVQFPQVGTFTVRSADAKHRAVLKVTVSGDSGCGAPKQTLTLSEVAAGMGGAMADKYSFSPKTLTVNAADNFAVVNKTDATHTIKCTPAAGSGNADNPTLDKGETQVLALDKAGKYTCTSTQHRDAKVVITVKGM